MKLLARLLLSVALLVSSVHAEPVAKKPVFVDAKGVIRWTKDRSEVKLFGADYCAFSGGDYRMAGLVHADRKHLIDEDMAHFARMGWDGMRLCSWGDWENADEAGNLITNDHSDLMDYLIATAQKRGINILLTPIHTYDPSFADMMGSKTYRPHGFSSIYSRAILGTDPKAIEAETNYISQLLNHINPYTDQALKDQPNILFIEMINEPVHHAQDLNGSIAYINKLVEAVRATGSQQITFHNYSQDFAIGEALAKSKVDGIDFGWYPSGLVAGHELKGNFLQAVDNYAPLLEPKLLNKPRIVYEFDQADLNTAYMFPAMARSYRGVGAQFAAIFAYDMLDTAPYNLGWQTHFINLVHTPRQAMSAVIAGEAMKRLPRMGSYGPYPQDRQFGDFSVDYEHDSSLLNADNAYINAGDSDVAPKTTSHLTRIAGFGSSPLISYEGTGNYFLDKVKDGVWRLELYPDAILVSDPFAQPQPDKVVSRLYFRTWPIRVQLPDLGPDYHLSPLNIVGQNQGAQQAKDAVVNVSPGVWLLSRDDRFDIKTLPATINRIGLKEYYVNAPLSYPDVILPLTAPEFVVGTQVELRVRLASAELPDTLSAYIRSFATNYFRKPIEMKRVHGDIYSATIADLPSGRYDYIVTETKGEAAISFPGGIKGKPFVWPFVAGETFGFSVTEATAPLRIFEPKRDIKQMSFVRPNEGARSAFFAVVEGESSDDLALSLAMPDLGAKTPDLYAGALYIGDRVAARGRQAAKAKAISLRLRAEGGAHKNLDIVLIEKDGSSWLGTLTATSDWQTISLNLEDLKFSPSLLIPTPFPGLWDYWRPAPKDRGSGKIKPESIERIELRIHSNADVNSQSDAKRVEIEWAQLLY